MSGSVGEAPEERVGRKALSGARSVPRPSLSHDALLDCCRSVHGMTLEIGEALRSNNRGVLTARLQERGNLIEEMGSLQSPSALLPGRERGREGEGEKGSEEMMEEIKTLLEAVLSLDDVHKARIIHKSEEISRQLKKLRDGRQLLRSSYLTFPASKAKLVDVV